MGQLLGDGEGVDGLPALVKGFDRLEDEAVALAVEVLLAQADVDKDRLDGALGDHHRAQHRFLGFEVLRWKVGLYGCHELGERRKLHSLN